jgi:hypothetical protein
MKSHAFVATIALLLGGRDVLACYETIITYDVTRECSVLIVDIRNEDNSPIPPSEWDAAVERWTEYLQSNATTLFDRKYGVPPTARKTHRGGGEHNLYCEFEEHGAILAAYVLPVVWVEAKREWVLTGRQSVPVSKGKLEEGASYESTITTCH